jgi:hypothetical protein
MRTSDDAERFGTLPWLLLGVHSARLDIGSRDLEQDEALGLNCAWYSGILPTLVAPRAVVAAAAPVEKDEPAA